MAEVKSIAQRVREVIAEQTGVSNVEVTDGKTMPDMGADSMEVFEVMMALEDEFHIEVSDADLDKLRPLPVREWVQYVEARMAARAA